ncbi:MAG: hypothetical protein WKF71_14940 [Pyrinomonadaceae bacterium]
MMESYDAFNKGIDLADRKISLFYRRGRLPATRRFRTGQRIFADRKLRLWFTVIVILSKGRVSTVENLVVLTLLGLISVIKVNFITGQSSILSESMI